MSLEPVELCDLTQEGAIFNPILDAAISDEDILVDERRLEEIDLQPIGDKLMDMMRRGVPLKRYRNPMEIYQMLLYGLKRLANKKREVLAKKAEKALEEARATLLEDVDMNAVKEFVDSNKSPKKPKKGTGAKKKTPAVPEKGDDTLMNDFLVEPIPEDRNLMVEKDIPRVNQESSFGFENPPGAYPELDITGDMRLLNIPDISVIGVDVGPDEQLPAGAPEVAADVQPEGVQPAGVQPGRRRRRRRSRRRRSRRRSSLQSIYDLLNDMDHTFETGLRELGLGGPQVLVGPDAPPVIVGEVQPANVDEPGLLDEAAGGPMPEEVVELPEVNNEKLNSSRDVFDLLLPKWQAGDFPLRLNDILPKENSSLLRRTTGIESLMRLYEKDIVSIKFDEDRAITNILPGPLLLSVGNVVPEVMELYSSDSN